MVSENPSDEEALLVADFRKAKAFDTVNLAGPRGVSHIRLVPVP